MACSARSVAAERAAADKLVAAWLAALAREGLIRAGDEPESAAFTVAPYAYLAKTPALLIGVSLAEALGAPLAEHAGNHYRVSQLAPPSLRS